MAVALLLENAGVPVPGETILLLASFLAYSEHQLSLPWIIVTGTIAATLGDNLGFTLGHYGGRPLMLRYQRFFHISDEAVKRGEDLLQRHGAPIIFVARFIFGLRIVAGPMAGVLGMHWAQFALFNFLGAALWVTVISCAGYFFGSQWETLIRVMRGANLIFLLIALIVVAAIWWRRRQVSK